MSVANILTYRTLICDNLTVIEDVHPRDIKFAISYNPAIARYELVCDMSHLQLRCRGDSLEGAYKRMFRETALKMSSGEYSEWRLEQ